MLFVKNVPPKTSVGWKEVTRRWRGSGLLQAQDGGGRFARMTHPELAVGGRQIQTNIRRPRISLVQNKFVKIQKSS